MSKVRSAFRRDRTDWDLSDTAPFDFSDELVEDETPKFNKLKVVVSGEMSDYSAGAASNGVAVNTLVVADDDDSLLESSSSLGSPGLNMDPCDSCTKKREKIKHRRVMKRLVFAALLYFLFMTGEIVGKHVQEGTSCCITIPAGQAVTCHHSLLPKHYQAEVEDKLAERLLRCLSGKGFSDKHN